MADRRHAQGRCPEFAERGERTARGVATTAPALLALLIAGLLPGCGGGNPGVNGWDATGRDVPVEDAAGDPWVGPDTDEPRDLAADGTPDVAPRDPGTTADPGAPTDVAPTDPGNDAASTDATPLCPNDPTYDYTCTPGVELTCLKGICILGMCIGPVRDPGRWNGCGDGVCDPCEGRCPADCGPAPVFTGTKEYVNDTTITVWVHGFSNKSSSEMKKIVYGRDRGCGGLLTEMRAYGFDRPCSTDPGGATAPNQMSRVEYYGGTPADWLTADQIAEIEQFPYSGPTALHRYGLIVAKFIRHKLATTGATHVNLACHSMGCFVLRYVIENDLEGLASERRFVRWFTSAGVIAGAQLARLYDNPTVRQAGPLIGLELSDFVIMHPDFVQDFAAAWDHRLHEGNSPYLGGTIIHHLCGTDPKIREALNIALLDLNNPSDEPNDGIMYTEGEFFHSQSRLGTLINPQGRYVRATRSYVREYHMEVPNTPQGPLLAAATMMGSRKVFLRIRSIELLKDRESRNLFDGENGKPPAEVTMRVGVRYDPYVQQTFGRSVLVHEDRPEHRGAPLIEMSQNYTMDPDFMVFEGPVFDEMTSIRVEVELLEADWYPRFGVREYQFNIHERLIQWSGDVPLQDGNIDFQNEYAKVRMNVQVLPMY